MNVYFAAGSYKNEYTKIGVAEDTDARMQQLQTGNPYPVYVQAEIEGAGVIIERALHRFMRQFRRRGEWFKSNRAFWRGIETFCSRRHLKLHVYCEDAIHALEKGECK